MCDYDIEKFPDGTLPGVPVSRGIKDGQYIRLNGTEGYVEILSD